MEGVRFEVKLSAAVPSSSGPLFSETPAAGMWQQAARPVLKPKH